MLNADIADFYERDIRKLMEEVKLFKDEENLWKKVGHLPNCSGNLVLHIIGNLNHFVGAALAHTGYVRDRESEFTRKGVPINDLITGLEELIPIVRRGIPTADLNAEYPLVFDGSKRTTGYMLVHLLAHLNYHLGQVNYLRRVLE